MRSRQFRWLRVFVIGLAVVGAMGHDVTSAAEVEGLSIAPRPFIVFDATLYKNKPSFSDYPVLRPITVLYEWPLFLAGQSSAGLPSEQKVRSAVKELS